MTTESEVIASLARSGTHPIELNGYHPIVLNPITGVPQSIESFLVRPTEIKQVVHLMTITSLCDYITTHHCGHSHLYVLPRAGAYELEAVLDDHDREHPGTRHHIVKFDFIRSESWKEWIALSGKKLTQGQFADFIEEHAKEIVEPEPAAVLEVARSLHVIKSDEITSVIRQGGNHVIKLSNEQKVKCGGDAEIPTTFRLRVKPFGGLEDSIDVVVRLRVSVPDQKAAFEFKLQDVDLHEQGLVTEKAMLVGKACNMSVFI